MPRMIMAIKDAHPDVSVLADVALDPYSSLGQDGIVDEETGYVMNDMTVYQICKQVRHVFRRLRMRLGFTNRDAKHGEFKRSFFIFRR